MGACLTLTRWSLLERGECCCAFDITMRCCSTFGSSTAWLQEARRAPHISPGMVCSALMCRDASLSFSKAVCSEPGLHDVTLHM